MAQVLGQNAELPDVDVREIPTVLVWPPCSTTIWAVLADALGKAIDWGPRYRGRQNEAEAA